jgi:hypothetical protein
MGVPAPALRSGVQVGDPRTLLSGALVDDRLACIRANDAFVEQLGASNAAMHLEELNLSQCVAITNDALVHLSRFPRLWCATSLFRFLFRKFMLTFNSGC